MYNTVLFWWLDRNTENIYIVTMISPTKNKNSTSLIFDLHKILACQHYTIILPTNPILWCGKYMSIVVGQKHNTVCVFLRFTLPPIHNTDSLLLPKLHQTTSRNGNFQDVFEKLTDNKTNYRNALYYSISYKEIKQ